MKVIFLDVDGVLNSKEFIMSQHINGKRKGGIIGTSDEMMDRLQTIVKESGAIIVMSSSWRGGFMAGNEHFEKNITKPFAKRNMFITDITPRDRNMERGLEIKAWLDKHPEVERFIILDDEEFDIHEHYPKQLVKTDWKIGLQDQHVELALIKLNKAR